MFLASKIFEVKRKDVKDDALTSNILSGDFSMTKVSSTLQQVLESSSGDVS